MRPSQAVVFLLLSACHAGAIDDRASARLHEARDDADRAVRYASCADGSAIGPGCGLITRHVATDRFRERFHSMRCSRRTAEECPTLYERAIDAWLLQRYWAVDQRAVVLSCDARPGYCDDPLNYERALLDSHNARIRVDLARNELAIEDERRRSHDSDMERSVDGVVNVLDNIEYATHKGPRCRSYPSLFGRAVNTICTSGRP